MADLKANSTVGGAPIWHKGNFPLFPTGDTLLFKTYKVYTEKDKPQAVDNDFVSKASGGAYLNTVTFSTGAALKTTDGQTAGIFPGNGDGATFATANWDLISKSGIGFRANPTAARTIIFNTTTGEAEFASHVRAGGQVVIGATAPTAATHATRKDYVDGQINTVTANANTRVLRAGDTMTGTLTAPNFFSVNPASQASHVPRFDQIVIKDSIQDFGYY